MNNVINKEVKQDDQKIRIIDDITGKVYYPSSKDAFKEYETLSRTLKHSMSLLFPAEIMNTEKTK